MVLWTFTELLIIDVTVYGAGLFLEYISLIALRLKEPGAIRPFKIPLRPAGICIMTLLPLAVYAIALSGTFLSTKNNLIPALFALGLLFTAEISWQAIRWRQRHLVKS
jgi:hypothetical protein